MSKTSLHVLGMLAEGKFLSGEQIGRELGISRMAVSKAVKALSEKGLRFISVPGKGYQLKTAVQLLDIDLIYSLLDDGKKKHVEVGVLHEIDSTSDYLLRHAQHDDFCWKVCLAESQIQGRGRRQRPWVSSAYRNIVLSFSWDFEDGMSALSGLGVAAGICIVRALHEAGFDREIGLKWPNDIVWQDGKLGGLLIDVRGEHDGPCTVVLGLGLNLSLSQEDRKMIDQPAVSLEQIADVSVNRNFVVVVIINALRELFTEYSSRGFEYYQNLWPYFDRLSGREVIVIRGDASYVGKAAGIDDKGALLIDVGGSITKKFYSGDVSLRLKK